jgi:hypothetical protein
MSPNINGNKNEQVSDIKEIKFSCMDSNIEVDVIRIIYLSKSINMNRVF